MSSKTKQREESIKQFRSLTNASQADANRLMKAASYRLEAAIELFYGDAAAMSNASKASGSSSSAASASGSKDAEKKLSAIFDQYKDAESTEGDVMNIEGTMEYCGALGLDPEDVVLLPLSFYLDSPTMGKFTKQGFVQGWKTLSEGTSGSSSCTTMEGQKKRLPRLAEELKSDEPVRGDLATKGKGGLYKRVYEYAYNFARPEGQKSLPLESALAFWDLLLPHSPTFQGNGGSFTPHQLTLWKQYLTDKTNNRAVSKDTWSLFLDFTKDIDPEFKEHDFDAAWPSLIDGFATWAQEQMATNGTSMDES